MNNFLWLEHWFHGLCDGTWEKQHTLRFETLLDRPGWRVTIDLKDTPFDQARDAEIKNMNVSERDWMTCRIRGSVFEGVGGPLMLGPIVQVLRSWIESY